AGKSVAGATRRGTGGSLAAIKWRFNAWAKYPNWKKDEKIGSRMAKVARAHEIRPVFNSERVVLEGGSIDSNAVERFSLPKSVCSAPSSNAIRASAVKIMRTSF